MHPKLAFVVCLSFAPLGAWQQPQPLDQVLPRIQQNVAQFVDSLPDFVSNEKIISTKFSKGQAVKNNTAESLFTGIQKRSSEGGWHFVETRDVITQDGKASKKGARVQGPFILNGGFGGAVNSTFHADIAPYREYRLETSEVLSGKSMIVIGFSNKKGQTHIRAAYGRSGFIQVDTGKAWVDPDSMQIARLDYTISNTPGRYPILYVSVEYGPAMIGGKTFWMPKNVRCELRRTMAEEPVARFLAEYSNYRKFDVSSGIVDSHNPE